MANLAPKTPIVTNIQPYTPIANQHEVPRATYGLLGGNSPPQGTTTTKLGGEVSMPPPSIAQPGVDRVSGWVPPWNKSIDLDQDAFSDEEDLQV
jgi:hypothetical protein